MREARTCPNVPWPLTVSLRLLRGSSKFRWLGTLVKLLSNFNLNLSVSWKSLPSPRERLIVPGPTSDPGVELPNRPIVPTVEQPSVLLSKFCPGAPPGQANTFGFHHCAAV